MFTRRSVIIMAIRAVASTATLLAVLASFGLLLNDMGSISALPIAAGLAVLVLVLVLLVQLASRQTTRNHHQH